MLLVEDDESHAFLMSQAMSECNVSNMCDIAKDGIDALERMYEAARSGKPYDLVLMDLNMPRLDGREALSRMKSDEDLRRTPVVIMTTSSNENDITDCYARGAASYIMKPFDLDGLFVAMELTLTYWCKLSLLPGSNTVNAA